VTTSVTSKGEMNPTRQYRNPSSQRWHGGRTVIIKKETTSMFNQQFIRGISSSYSINNSYNQLNKDNINLDIQIKDYIENFPSLKDNLNKNMIEQLKLYVVDINGTNIEDIINNLDFKYKKLFIYLVLLQNYMDPSAYIVVNDVCQELIKLGMDEGFIEKVRLNMINCPINTLTYIEPFDLSCEEVKSGLIKLEDKSGDNKESNINVDIWKNYIEIYFELVNLAKKRNANVNREHWKLISLSLRCSEMFNLAELNEMREEIINHIKSEFTVCAMNRSFKEKRLVPHNPYIKKGKQSRMKELPRREFTDKEYQNQFDNILVKAFLKLKNYHITWLTEMETVWGEVSMIRTSLLQYCKRINEILLSSYYSGRIVEKYSNNPKILKRSNEFYKIKITDFLSKSLERNVKGLWDHLESIGKFKFYGRIHKWQLEYDNTFLSTAIDKILNSEISQEDKQMAVEKAIFEYDFHFSYVKRTDTSNKMTIYTREFINMENNFNNVIDKYIVNKSRLLKREFYFDKTKINAIIILLLSYIGKERVLSFILKQVINQLLVQLDGYNKTNLLFNLSNKFIKSFKIFALRSINEDNTKDKEESNVFQSIKEICSLKELLHLIENLSDEDIVKIGDTLFTLLEVNSLIIEEKVVRTKINHTEIKVAINPDYLKEIITSNMQMSQLPMVIPPKAVRSNGEYYPYFFFNTNVINLEDCQLIKGKNDQMFKTIGSNKFYKSIDFLNNIKFRINNVMLDFILKEWMDDNSSDSLFKGFNIYKEILPEDSKENKNEKIRHNSIYFLYYNIISIAMLFRNQTFYLPVFADFRGRIYTLSSYLTYQGTDLARSLILFDNDEIINENGKECLNVYLTNLAGYDKLSWNSRLGKVDEIMNKFDEAIKEFPNKEKIIKLVENLSEPFQFLSIAFAKLHTSKYEEEGNNEIIVNNPILFDASCSGIQHISALTLDTNLATYTNVVTTKDNPKDELPEDFYSYALVLIQKRLLESKNERLQNLKLTRKIIKRSVMTVPYNISLTGIGGQLEEHFNKKWDILKYYNYFIPASYTFDNRNMVITSKDFGLLTTIVFEVLTKDIPSLKHLTTYFKDIIKLLNKLNMPITWITPAGIKIRYQQKHFDSKVVTNKLGSKKPITITIPTNRIDRNKMLRSFMPNFIHSLDACNVHLLLYSLIKNNKNVPVYTIHDCFASSPNHLSLLELKVKEAFIDIYFKNKGYLLKTHEEIIKQINQVHDIYEIDGKLFIDMSQVLSKNNDKNIELKYPTLSPLANNEITDLEIPSLPESFKNNKLNDFIKGLLKSKYFIG
jgi:hypothetical protein